MSYKLYKVAREVEIVKMDGSGSSGLRLRPGGQVLVACVLKSGQAVVFGLKNKRGFNLTLSGLVDSGALEIVQPEQIIRSIDIPEPDGSVTASPPPPPSFPPKATPPPVKKSKGPLGCALVLLAIFIAIGTSLLPHSELEEMVMGLGLVMLILACVGLVLQVKNRLKGKGFSCGPIVLVLGSLVILVLVVLVFKNTLNQRVPADVDEDVIYISSPEATEDIDDATQEVVPIETLVPTGTATKAEPTVTPTQSPTATGTDVPTLTPTASPTEITPTSLPTQVSTEVVLPIPTATGGYR
jgi:hypothetical protein